jgi:hypothetical protein
MGRGPPEGGACDAAQTRCVRSGGAHRMRGQEVRDRGSAAAAVLLTWAAGSYHQSPLVQATPGSWLRINTASGTLVQVRGLTLGYRPGTFRVFRV